MEKDNVIIINGLTKRFGKFTAVDHISFSVRKGEIFGFLGANGAGKTTAMKILCGLSFPTEGRGTVNGYDINTQQELIKRNIGYMSQKFSLYPDLKVWENIRLFGGIYGLGFNEIRTETDKILKSLEMEKLKDSLVGSLPLGWKQKLAFSIAIIHKPAIGRRGSGNQKNVLGNDIQDGCSRHYCIRNHPLHGRSRILRPRINNGGRSNSRPRYSRCP